MERKMDSNHSKAANHNNNKKFNKDQTKCKLPVNRSRNRITKLIAYWNVREVFLNEF